MKKLIIACVLMLLTACNMNADQTVQNSPTPSPKASASAKPSEQNPPKAAAPEEAAAAILSALKEKNLDSLAAYVHPDKGLLFSPYAHIDTASAKVFPADELPALADPTVHHFGDYDGSGEPIDLTFKQYYDKFVYDKDFLHAEKVGADQIIGSGNMMVNIKDVFPGSYVMDYHFSGFDAQYEGMDWESLILVLEELNGSWYVSAIVHSQWTT
ncbi:hypothetical protein FHS16_002601 [Paenibacillus endophyticus]|uniref:Nuclear transport factor 2 family protein n=1 Tax=Paenibacillus endophyticus TaxID=1294268 RepID=A0A7W5C7F9_9BACL|nr:hypothetical protein [Paenibacillus endophyticus]MBB3152551.1 hypothetical protein [Paenibacillus endophyticus]